MSLEEQIARKLIRYRDYPSYFLEHELDSKPFYYNVPFLDSLHPMLAYRAGRQGGKTNSIAGKTAHFSVFANYRCNLPPDVGTAHVLITSYKEEQAQTLFNRMCELMDRSELVKNQVEKDLTSTRTTRWLLGEGKTTVRTVALGEGGVGGRGPSPSVIIVDEYDYVGEDRLDALLPSGIARDAMWWVASTPDGKQGPFYSICKNARMGNLPIDDVHSHEPDTEWEQHCAISSMSPLCTPRYLRVLRSRMTEEKFRQETEAAFIDGGAYMYPSDVLVHALRLKFKENQLPSTMIGLDVAGMGVDETVWFVMKHDGIKGKIIHIEAQGISNTMGVASHTIQLMERYNADMVSLENNGIGKGVADVLRDQGIPVTAHEISIKTKVDMHVNCLRVLEGSNLDASYCDSLRHPLMEQAMMISRKATEDGRMKLVGGRHDDYPAAMALACLILGQSSGMEVIKTDILSGRRRRPMMGGLITERSIRRLQSSPTTEGQAYHT